MSFFVWHVSFLISGKIIQIFIFIMHWDTNDWKIKTNGRLRDFYLWYDKSSIYNWNTCCLYQSPLPPVS
jgi:hypothetical protein